jgi:hypothetical protein
MNYSMHFILCAALVCIFYQTSYCHTYWIKRRSINMNENKNEIPSYKNQNSIVFYILYVIYLSLMLIMACIVASIFKKKKSYKFIMISP